MGLDISKIQNAELQKLAYKADADNNGMLNAEELSVFKAEALEKEGVSAEDFNQAMGLYKSAAATATEATAATAPKEVKTSKKDRKVFEANITNFVKQMVKNGATPEKLLQSIGEQYNSDFYKSVADDIKAVIKAVQDTKYDSKEDIENIKKSVKKGLNSFQKDVLDEVIKAAETDQILKETDELIEIYKEVKGDKTLYTENKNGEKVLNLTECEKAVKKELSKKGLKKESYYSGKALDLLKEYIKQDSGAIHDSKVVDTEGETRRKVKKEVKTTNAKGDHYANKTTRQKKEVQKIAADHNRYEHNLEELKGVSAEELKKELGKDLFGKLAATYLNEEIQNEDGTFDVSSLAEAILYRVGYDYTMNQSKDTEMSELKNVQAELKALTGQDFSKAEVNKLLKFCAIRREKNSHNPLKGLTNAVTAAATSALAAFNSTPIINVHQSVNLSLSSSVADQIISQLSGYITDKTELADGKVLVKISQDVFKDDRWLNVVSGAGLGVLGATLLQMIFGEGKEFEKSCISIADFDFSNPRYTNFEEYEKYVKSRYPEAKANAIISLAKLCQDEDGKFDAAKFDSMTKHIAGVGSNLNCKEVKGGTLYADKTEKTPEKPAVKPEENCGKDDKVCNAVVTKEETEATEKTEDLTKIHKTTYGDTWQGLVEAYYPDLVEKCGGLWGKNGAIRALKEALAGGDKDVLKKLLEGGNLPNTIKLPASINGVERQDGTVKKQKVHGNGKSLIKEVGKDDVRVTKIPGTTTYKAVDGCDEKVAPAYGSSAEEATANLEKQTGKKYDKIIEQ